jgi:hypothetical protein
MSKKFASTILKKRFTVKYPDGTIKQFGTCREDEDERYGILEWNGLYFLAQYHLDDINYEREPKNKELLPEGTTVTDDYYEREWGEFLSPKEWLSQP